MRIYSLTYFMRSPFRSVSFNLVTLILIGFLFSGIRQLGTMSDPPVRHAVRLLIALPVLVWVWSLFLHMEIHFLAERIDKSDFYSRLPQLLLSVVFATTLISYLIIEALTLGPR